MTDLCLSPGFSRWCTVPSGQLCGVIHWEGDVFWDGVLPYSLAAQITPGGSESWIWYMGRLEFQFSYGTITAPWVPGDWYKSFMWSNTTDRTQPMRPGLNHLRVVTIGYPVNWMIIDPNAYLRFNGYVPGPSFNVTNNLFQMRLAASPP